MPEKIILRKSILGEGAVITKDVKEVSILIGIPAREMQKGKDALDL